MRVDFPDGTDVHQFRIFAVGVDGAEQRAARVSYSGRATLAG